MSLYLSIYIYIYMCVGGGSIYATSIYVYVWVSIYVTPYMCHPLPSSLCRGVRYWPHIKTSNWRETYRTVAGSRWYTASWSRDQSSTHFLSTSPPRSRRWWRWPRAFVRRSGNEEYTCDILYARIMCMYIHIHIHIGAAGRFAAV